MTPPRQQYNGIIQCVIDAITNPPFAVPSLPLAWNRNLIGNQTPFAKKFILSSLSWFPRQSRFAGISGRFTISLKQVPSTGLCSQIPSCPVKFSTCLPLVQFRYFHSPLNFESSADLSEYDCETSSEIFAFSFFFAFAHLFATARATITTVTRARVVRTGGMEPLPSKHKANLTEMKIQMTMFSLADLRANQLESEMVCGWLISESWFCGNPVRKLRTKMRFLPRTQIKSGNRHVIFLAPDTASDAGKSKYSSLFVRLLAWILRKSKSNLNSLYTRQECQFMQAG